MFLALLKTVEERFQGSGCKHTDSGNVTLNLFQGLLSCVNVFYVLPGDADPPEADTMTWLLFISVFADIRIAAELFFICGRVRGASES